MYRKRPGFFRIITVASTLDRGNGLRSHRNTLIHENAGLHVLSRLFTTSSLHHKFIFFISHAMFLPRFFMVCTPSVSLFTSPGWRPMPIFQ